MHTYHPEGMHYYHAGVIYSPGHSLYCLVQTIKKPLFFPMWQTLVEEVVFVKSVVMLYCLELKGMNERLLSREEATIRICVHLIARRRNKQKKKRQL